MTIVAGIKSDYKFYLTTNNIDEYSRLKEATEDVPYRKWLRGFTFSYNIYDLDIVIALLDKAGLCERSMSHELWERVQIFRDGGLTASGVGIIVDLEPPHRKLLPFHHEAVRKLIANKSFILCDDVGLGKTAECLAAIAILIEAGEIEHAFVLSNTSSLHKWEAEKTRMFGDALDIINIKGTIKKREKLWMEDHQVYCVTIDTFKNDYLRFMKSSNFFKKRFRKSLGLIDEVHRIKKSNTKTSEACHLWGHYLKYRWGATATPIDGKLESLYSIMKFIHPHLFCTASTFYSYHINLDYFGNPVSYNHIDVINTKIKPFFLRRMKRDVMDDLPDIIIKDFPVQLTKEERNIYEEISEIDDKVTLLSDEANEKLNRDNLVSRVLYAAMTCDTPRMIDPTYTKVSSKMKALKGLVEVIAPHHKLVVFSKYRKVIMFLEEYLGTDWKTEILVGGMKDEDRQAGIERFLTDESVRLFLMNTAGKESIDLHGLEKDDVWHEGANYLIKFDSMWNPSVNEQINGRIDRVGQTKKMTVIDMYCEDTIEDEGVREKLLKKLKINREVLEKRGA